MPELRVTELDFNQIKANLKAFLSAQEEFSDYDFEGSGLSVLIDLLSYNTHYNALLTHLLANESFLDTAIKRSSVVSLAKTLGYVPRSYTSARATVNIEVTQTSGSPSLTLSKFTKFTTTINNRSFTFYPADEQTVDVDDGMFTFSDVILIEGTLLSNSFVVTADKTSGPFVLPTNTIDISTLVVTVQKSASEVDIESFTRETEIINIGGDDAVYWIEENSDGKYVLRFGDGVFGKALEVGNIVVARYLSSSGSAANGARFFVLSGAIANEANASVETVQRAAAGSEKETIDSIRFNAPRFNTTRNRAVTAQDYKSLILAGFDRIKSVSVWGGEENDPPIYGKVFITLDPKEGYVITDGDKQFILNNIILPRSMMSIQHEFVDSEYLYVGFDVRVLYDARTTTLSSSEIASAVRAEIERFFENDITTLDQTFLYTQFVDAIQTSNNSILSVLSKPHLQRRLNIPTNTTTSEITQFLSALQPSSVKSVSFIASVSGADYTVYIQDFPNNSVAINATTGTLKLLEPSTNTVIDPDIGYVNYVTGKIVIEDINITQYLGSLDSLHIQAFPKELDLNISPRSLSTNPPSEEATVPTPAKNVIIALDDSEASSAALSRAGLTVTAVPYID